ncbi:MAG: hypothetical protein ACOCRN_04280 [Spirochaetia bacterium]
MLLHIVLGLGGALVVLLLFPAIRRPDIVKRRGGKRHLASDNVLSDLVAADTMASEVARGGQKTSTKTCPVCHTPLAPGERIKSVVYRKGGRQHGTITEFATEIYGCPHCYPANSRHPRICPVCRGEVNTDGYLIARMLERKGRKPHVRVLGCTACRDNRRMR